MSHISNNGGYKRKSYTDEARADLPELLIAPVVSKRVTDCISLLGKNTFTFQDVQSKFNHLYTEFRIWGTCAVGAIYS